MIKEVIATGKDVTEATENAKAALGAGENEEVQIEVLHLGSRGIFGIIGVKPAQVRAYIEIKDREERRHRPERKKKADRPERRREEEAPKVTAEAPATAEAEAASESPKKKHKKHKKHSGNSLPRAEKTASAPKERSVVIPECELKMERREVSVGEDMSYDFVCTLLRDMGIDAVAELYSCEDGTRRITITGADAHTLIGHHGDTLDALQYLANLASARKNVNGERDKSRVTLDIEGYRQKREETLRALARRMAAKALRNKRSVMLEPMSAYERRIIHSEVQLIEGVSTNSIGSDNNRKIVIYLTDKKPEGIFEEDNDTASADEGAISMAGVLDTSVTSDLEDEDGNETVAVETTVPVDSVVSEFDGDDDDIK